MTPQRVLILLAGGRVLVAMHSLTLPLQAQQQFMEIQVAVRCLGPHSALIADCKDSMTHICGAIVSAPPLVPQAALATEELGWPQLSLRCVLPRPAPLGQPQNPLCMTFPLFRPTPGAQHPLPPPVGTYSAVC